MRAPQEGNTSGFCNLTENDNSAYDMFCKVFKNQIKDNKVLLWIIDANGDWVKAEINDKDLIL